MPLTEIAAIEKLYTIKLINLIKGRRLIKAMMEEMIRKAKESDIEEILNVLSSYNFKVINAIDNSPIDNDATSIITVYNQVSQIDLKHAFIALHDRKIVGFCHYKHLEEGVAKTTLIAVLPQYRRLGL